MRICLIICVAGLLVAAEAGAHGIAVSATSGGDGMLRGEAFYSDGEPVGGERVDVYRKAGANALYSGVTDTAGRFAFLVADGGEYKVVVNPPDGHRAETRVVVGASSAGGASEVAQGAGTGELARGVSASELAQVRADIARLERRLRLSDLIGGIGLLAGAAGAYVLIGRRRAG